jgi:2-methylcitrate dehydratase PrpD
MTQLVLLDTLGVTIAGAQTQELIALRDSWDLGSGVCSLAADARQVPPQDAMWLNGTASCSLELDEGNKFAKGHPAAHVLFAILTQAEILRSTGSDFLAAFLAGHEIAARFGRATTVKPAVHTHGHWGALGAAAGVARLQGARSGEIAAAIDNAAGLTLATPWELALRGSFIRNTWVAAANVAGSVAATLGRANLSTVDGTPSLTLGNLLGDLDPAQLTEHLGERYDITLGYFKRHPSCSYTHPMIDIILDLKSRHDLDVSQLDAIIVETHSLAAPLNRVTVPTRLAAMFSIPYTVAVSLLDGAVTPKSFDQYHRTDSTIHQLMNIVTVTSTHEMDAQLPERRAARVTIHTKTGTNYQAETSNPVGDADNQPFGRKAIVAKLKTLLDADTVAKLDQAINALPHSSTIAELTRIIRQANLASTEGPT